LLNVNTAKPQAHKRGRNLDEEPPAPRRTAARASAHIDGLSITNDERPQPSPLKKRNLECATRQNRHCGKLHPTAHKIGVITMSLPLEVLELELLRLPPADRTRLLDRVIASLDADKARDKAWDAVAATRDAGIERGESVPIAGRDAITRLRSELT
jgi:hypothetical protein